MRKNKAKTVWLKKKRNPMSKILTFMSKMCKFHVIQQYNFTYQFK